MRSSIGPQSGFARRSRIMLIAVPLVIRWRSALVLGLHFVSQGNSNLQLSAQAAVSAYCHAGPLRHGPSPRPARRPPPPRRTAPATAAPASAAATGARARRSCQPAHRAGPSRLQLTGRHVMSPAASGCTMANCATWALFAQPPS